MKVIIRALSDQDKDGALWVEAGAMPDNRYLADVWELFTRKSDGALLGAFVSRSEAEADGGRLAGIGKITRLYGDHGWLETLRVHPDWQRKGIGAALWQGYFEEMAKMKLKSVGMYTEAENVASKALAEKNGLAVRAYFREYRRPVKLDPAASEGSPKCRAACAAVAPADGEAYLAAYYQSMPPFVVVNRTFYPTGPGLGQHLAEAGWLYRDGEGQPLIAGNRFHPQFLLHWPYFKGEPDQAMNCALNLAARQGAPALSCLCRIEDAQQALNDSPAIKYLNQLGFTEGRAFMTLWREL